MPNYVPGGQESDTPQYNPDSTMQIPSGGGYGDDHRREATIYDKLAASVTATKRALTSFEAEIDNDTEVTNAGTLPSGQDTATTGELGKSARAYWATAGEIVQKNKTLSIVAGVSLLGGLAYWIAK